MSERKHPPRTPAHEVERRISQIEQMMRALTWDRGRSNRELAARWNVAVATVNDYAAEAGRRVRAEVRNVDAVTDTVCVRLDRIVRTGEDREATKAADVWTKIVGARAPEKSEVTVQTAEAFDRLDKAGKLAWIDERMQALAQLREEVANEGAVLALPEGAQ